jgi:hypothetical protein
MILGTSENTTSRNCPKSLGRVYGVGLRTAEKALFGPFRTPYSGQIHARSVTRTPFRTVSLRGWVNKEESEREGAVTPSPSYYAEVACDFYGVSSSLPL